jgi:hypothetical protein
VVAQERVDSDHEQPEPDPDRRLNHEISARQIGARTAEPISSPAITIAEARLGVCVMSTTLRREQRAHRDHSVYGRGRVSHRGDSVERHGAKALG